MGKIVMMEDLQKKLQLCHTRAEIDRFIRKQRKVHLIGDFLISEGEERIKKGDYDSGITILISVYESGYIKDVYDDVTLYLRLAEYYIENGNTEKGKRFLILLCNSTVDNYEEALEIRKLKPVWEKYKHLVQESISSPSVTEDETIPSDEELLEELLEEVGSGGFDSYLSYHSRFYFETIQAARKLNKPLTAELLCEIAKKFPDGKVPKSPEKTEAIIIDNALDFESEDEYFYNTVEKELANN